MLTAVGQYLGARVVTALLVVSSAGSVIWFWRHPEHLETIWEIVKYVLVWLGFVVVLPWATFFVTPWVVRRESNAVAGLMLGAYLVADVMVAFWLIGGLNGLGSLTWGVLVLGFLTAGVYNFKVCEHQADALEFL